MAWFGSAVLRPAWAWIWRRLGLLWRCLTWLCVRALGLVAKPALPGPEERRGSDPEMGDEYPDTDPVTEDVEASHNEAAGVKRTAASHGDEVCKRPKYEDEDEEEEDEDEDEDDEDEEHGGVDTSDEFYCDYDSTWEDESEEKPSRRSRPPGSYRSYNFKRFERAAEDMQNFRHKYFNQSSVKHLRSNKRDDMPNLKFYLGQATSQPHGMLISDFHSKWAGDYKKLEDVHTFIQWLFPLQEPGVNYQARPLTPQEVEEFRESRVAKKNLVKSYRLMLDFYGIELCDEETGEVKKARHWKDRFTNLNRHTHNNLRITRMLKSLGILGFENYQVPLVRFFLEETLVLGELPRVKESVLSYFVFAVLDRRERRKLIKFAFFNYDLTDEFVWCPKKIQTTWLQKQTNVEGGACNSSPPPDSWSPNTEVPDDSNDDDTEFIG